MNTRRIIIVANAVCVLAILARAVTALLEPSSGQWFMKSLLILFALPYAAAIATLLGRVGFGAAARIGSMCAVVLLAGVAAVGVIGSSRPLHFIPLAIIGALAATAVANIWWIGRERRRNAG